VARFSLATTESYKNKEGQRVDQTEWHNIVLWRGLAETAEKYLRKGSMVYIEGRLKTRSWEDKDHNKRYTTEIVADVMTMLGRKSDENSGSDYSRSGEATPRQSEPEPGDDLPF
jgi:single-strand DNA-binding protein